MTQVFRALDIPDKEDFMITHVETPEVPNALLVAMEEGRVVGTRRVIEVPEAEI